MKYDVQILHPSGMISKRTVEASSFIDAAEYVKRELHPSLKVIGVIYLAMENLQYTKG